VSKIGILGQDEAIDEIIWSVFEPRKLPLQDRLELSKFRFDRLQNIVSNCYIDLKLARGVILYGPPGTGKTSIIRYVFIQFSPSFVFVFVYKGYMQLPANYT
jgi:MoxR-like ATPase